MRVTGKERTTMKRQGGYNAALTSRVSGPLGYHSDQASAAFKIVCPWKEKCTTTFILSTRTVISALLSSLFPINKMNSLRYHVSFKAFFTQASLLLSLT